MFWVLDPRVPCIAVSARALVRPRYRFRMNHTVYAGLHTDSGLTVISCVYSVIVTLCRYQIYLQVREDICEGK